MLRKTKLKLEMHSPVLTVVIKLLSILSTKTTAIWEILDLAI